MLRAVVPCRRYPVFGQNATFQKVYIQDHGVRVYVWMLSGLRISIELRYLFYSRFSKTRVLSARRARERPDATVINMAITQNVDTAVRFLIVQPTTRYRPAVATLRLSIPAVVAS